MRRRLWQQPIAADVAWLRVQLGKCGLAQQGGWLPFSAYQLLPYNQSTAGALYSASLSRAGTLRYWYQAAYVATTNDGSNYWTLQIRRLPGTNVIATLDTSALSVGTWSELSGTDLDIALDSAWYALYVNTVKTGSPGNLYLPSPAVFVT